MLHAHVTKFHILWKYHPQFKTALYLLLKTMNMLWCLNMLNRFNIFLCIQLEYTTWRLDSPDLILSLVKLTLRPSGVNTNATFYIINMPPEKNNLVQGAPSSAQCRVFTYMKPVHPVEMSIITIMDIEVIEKLLEVIDAWNMTHLPTKLLTIVTLSKQVHLLIWKEANTNETIIYSVFGLFSFGDVVLFGRSEISCTSRWSSGIHMALLRVRRWFPGMDLTFIPDAPPGNISISACTDLGIDR